MCVFRNTTVHDVARCGKPQHTTAWPKLHVYATHAMPRTLTLVGLQSHCESMHSCSGPVTYAQTTESLLAWITLAHMPNVLWNRSLVGLS